MPVFEFYRQQAGLASEISNRFSRRRWEPLGPSCSHDDQPKRPVTMRLGLATKIGNDRSTENSEEPVFKKMLQNYFPNQRNKKPGF
jgi:hypothetical protein